MEISEKSKDFDQFRRVIKREREENGGEVMCSTKNPIFMIETNGCTKLQNIMYAKRVSGFMKNE